MIVGISIQKENEIESLKIYSKPFLISSKIDNEEMILQIIRSNDCSFLASENDKFWIEIVAYRNKNEFYDLNKRITKVPLKIFGKYLIEINRNLLENFNESYSNYHLIKTLDNSFNLNIQFSVFYRIIEKDYVLTTPTLTCNKIYLNI
jgi:hypothetical protein